MPSISNPVDKNRIPPIVWIVSICMCLINISSSMVFGLSAVYLKTVMGLAITWIMVIEGIGEGASFIMKLMSGVLSDYLKKRKSIVVTGYTLIACSKLFLALSTTFLPAFFARIFERVGNGIQATPRDALISDVAPAHRKGTCFGLKRSLGQGGAFLGSAISFVIMYYSNEDFHMVFWIALIPAVVALLVLLFFVKEPPAVVECSITKHPQRAFRFLDLPLLGKEYWLLMLVTTLFMIARLGEPFLVIHASQNFGLRDMYAPMIIMLYQISYCLSSYPVGLLSDKLNRVKLLALSISVLIAADLALGFAQSLSMVLVGVLLWGVQMGAVQSVIMASIADMAPKGLRGTAFGFYYLLTAISAIIAASGGGIIADLFGESASFFASASVATCSLIALFIFKPQKRITLTDNQ